jgi:hypothetical protein
MCEDGARQDPDPSVSCLEQGSEGEKVEVVDHLGNRAAIGWHTGYLVSILV